MSEHRPGPGAPASSPESDLPTVERPAVAASPAPRPDRSERPPSAQRLISASAVMVAGTLVSRIVGFGRFVLLAYLFGIGTRQADMFAVANNVPNSMYILLAGGVLNTVLVPQIVRAVKNDRDGGEAYTNRILTGGLLVLFVITVALTLAVPLIVSLYTAGGWKEPAVAAQYQSMVMLGYFCMPQIFFYGVHVLIGQVLNARDRFGPMMWAPIANNVVSILVLLLFLVVFGQTNPSAAFTTPQELVLGLGSTLGIAVQAVVLVPYLRGVGFRFQPRFDFRHTGLGKTVRLAKWTLGFVVVSQAGLVVINKVASAATVSGAGGGVATYSYAYALWIIPHSLITVSLATAMLPSASRLAMAGDLAGTAAEVTRTLRLAVTALLPASIGLLVFGLPLARLVFGFGAGQRDADFAGWALMVLAAGLVPFTVQYICLRAFYALENTRTPFFLQLLITALNVAFGMLIVRLVGSNPAVAACLAGGFALAYAIGVLVSFRRLQRDLPDLALRPLGELGLRLAGAVLPGALVIGGAVWWVESGQPSQPVRAVTLTVAAALAVGAFLVLARTLRITEVGQIVATIRGRGGSGSGDDPEAPGDSNRGEGPASPTIEPSAAPLPPGGPIESADTMVTFVSAGRRTDSGPTPPADASPASTSAEGDALTPAPERTAAAPVRSSVVAGTILAGRYRLQELLAETDRAVTWRAFDLVLSRSVLVHLLAPHDPTAEELLEVARRAAAATDSRFLRVLDAVHSETDDLGSYVVCEYAAGQSLELVLSHGPLSGLEAAWVVREVADALSGVHAVGLFHQRISPDTVVLTPDGHVKIVGLLIEAALRPVVGDPIHGAQTWTPERRDVADLGRLLYGCLVSRWPGGPAFSLPAAPVSGRGWMTPRQVRAGVSPALDNVCDQILGDPPRHRAARLSTAHAVADALTTVLGAADASTDLERRLRQPIPKVTTTPSSVARNQTVSAPVVGSGPSPGFPVSPLSDSTRVTVIRQPPPPHAPPKAPAPQRPPRRRARRWIAGLAVLGLLLVATGSHLGGDPGPGRGRRCGTGWPHRPAERGIDVRARRAANRLGPGVRPPG